MAPAREELAAVFRSQSEQLRAACADLSAWHGLLLEAVDLLRQTFDAGGTLYIAGNGGSAGLAQHLSDELVGRYKQNRPPLPAVALTADSAVLTCIANDFGYEQVFARQLEALGRRGDLLLAFSTSGESPNILRAAEQARERGMRVIALTGGGRLRDLADLAVISPGQDTARIQELDLHAIHLICEAFEPR